MTEAAARRDTPVILLVEDNPADVRLTQEVLRDTGALHRLLIARDGVQALEMVRRQGSNADLPEPDIVLLDLNLPRKDGREVLSEMKHDPALKHIPVIVFSTSRAESDVVSCYNAHANCFVTKPVDLGEFTEFADLLTRFWLGHVQRAPKHAV